MAGRSTAQSDISSSPPRRESSRLLSPPRGINRKERRNPSITPRKFKRFFTPRERVQSHLSPGYVSPARRALRDLAGPDLNSRYLTPAPSSPLKPPHWEASGDSPQNENQDVVNKRAKRRKVHHTPDSSPSHPEALGHALLSATPRHDKPALLSPIRSLQSSQGTNNAEDSSEDDEDRDIEPVLRSKPLTSRGFHGQLLQRQLGMLPRPGRTYMRCPVADWRTETADFCSGPADVHSCASHDGPGRCIPFCTATCHTNTLVAVGDEEGRVRLLESSGDEAQPFSHEHLSFQAHSNAIIDLAFSADDYLLATASGDQTGRVMDMMTQRPIALLHHHTASLKQVRFQPGKTNGAVLATSSRDGSVQIWDLRCKGPVQEIHATERENHLGYRHSRPKTGCVVNSIYDTHARTTRQTRSASAGAPGDTPSRGELPGRIGDVSVTALQFLPAGQEHLLLTGCEADASIKLWDIRSTSRHNRTSSPLSTTAPPSSHSFWRPFGISSMALSTDSARLYALCKDNTVYAFSIPHLILGQAPELESKPGSEPPRRRLGGTTHRGLGPMYGFRHSSFHATSFYVKCAIRPARDGQGEMLAVGSSDSCAVLFPVAERNLRNDISGAMSSLTLESSTIATSNSQGPTVRPSTRRFQLQRSNSAANLALMREKDDIPIVRSGTPLIRGHDREVGALAWTKEGKLVTVGDDYLIRCWKEGREQARDLRVGGEGGGRRWGCGWADAGEGKAWKGDEEDDYSDDEC